MPYYQHVNQRLANIILSFETQLKHLSTTNKLILFLEQQLYAIPFLIAAKNKDKINLVFKKIEKHLPSLYTQLKINHADQPNKDYLSHLKYIESDLKNTKLTYYIQSNK